MRLTMKSFELRGDLRPVTGTWRAFDDINVSDIRKGDIYRSALEPSFVCWSLLWMEADGTLKCSFVEATGDLAAWPPTYNFNSRDILYYLKTLVSHDKGATWEDTGWREDLDKRIELCSDSEIRHVIPLRDGTLLRNYCHTVEGVTMDLFDFVYDEAKAAEDFPWSKKQPFQFHPKTFSVSRSADGGRTWEEIYLHRGKVPYLSTGFHQLRDGTIVSTGGIINDWNRIETWERAITESRDGGRTWSQLQVMGEAANDDMLVPQLFGQESDFVELSDGRLLLIQRAETALHMVQMYLRREASGRWSATRPRQGPGTVHTGYPFLLQASDGTIFFYSHQAIYYTCDEGSTWGSLPPAPSYYGQLVETTPGRIVGVTQRNIEDRHYPWRHDTSIFQTSFDYERTAVAEQTDSDSAGALALLGSGRLSGFHLCAEVRLDGEAGIAFNTNGNSYDFAAVVIPCNEFRAPGQAAGKEQDAIFMIGRSESGRLSVQRRQGIGKVAPGSWVEMQLDAAAGLVKAAVKTSADRPAFYFVMREDPGTGGGLGLFTNKSSGAFKNIRLGSGATEIRSSWGKQ